jgi:hypothetical protein
MYKVISFIDRKINRTLGEYFTVSTVAAMTGLAQLLLFFGCAAICAGVELGSGFGTKGDRRFAYVLRGVTLSNIFVLPASYV